MILRVKNPLLIDTIFPDLSYSNIAYEGDYEVISGIWIDINGEVVNEGEISIIFTNSVDEEIISKTSVNQGNYTIILNYTNMVPGAYEWKISFTSPGYEPWEDLPIKVTVLAHNYAFDVQINDELKPGEKYIITTLVYYEDNTTDSNLSLNQLFSKGKSGESVPVEGIEVNFDILLVYKDGSKIRISISAMTDEVGLAFIELSSEDTTSLVSISEIAIGISGHSFGNANSIVLSSTQLPSIDLPEPEISIKIQNILMDNLIIVFIFVASIFIAGFIFLAQKQKRQDEMSQLDMAIQVAYQEIDALLSIQSIVIQNTTKLNVYSEQLGELDLNSTLIGGMVSAFSTFLNEVGKQELFGFEIMEREGVSITSHQGKISNFIIISTEKIPYTLLDQIKVAQQLIEKKHKDYFSTNRRGVLNLKKEQVRPLFEEAGFKISILGNYTLQPNNMKKLLKESSISSSMKNNVKSLLDFDKHYNDARQMSFDNIQNYFYERDMPLKMTSRAIILAYRYKIIIPKGFASSEKVQSIDSTPSSEITSDPEVSESKPLTWRERKIRDMQRAKNNREYKENGGN